MSLDKLGGKHRIALVSNIDDDLLQATPVPGGIDLVCTAERARGYKPDGTLFRYLIANAGVAVPEILHSGQSQHTDMVGGKPLWQQIHLRIAAGKRGGRRHRMPGSGQSETNVTTERWSAVEWIADADLDQGIVLLRFGSTLPKSAQCVPSSRPSNSMLGLRQTTP